MKKFVDRQEAGKVLAKHLQEYAHRPDALVLALPRGGVPVAYEIATTLHLPLDLLIVRKLGVPGHEELAFGAISHDDTVVYNDEVIRNLNLSAETMQTVLTKERQELRRRNLVYRDHKPFPLLTDQTIILVDDGIATGATLRAAIQTLRKHEPAQIIAAVPVAAKSTCQALTGLVDRLVCPLQPELFDAVGAWYEDFAQTSDFDVKTLLERL